MVVRVHDDSTYSTINRGRRLLRRYPPTLFDPNTRATYVLLRKETYDELTSGSQADVERLAGTIDWNEARKALRPPQEWFDGDEPKPF